MKANPSVLLLCALTASSHGASITFTSDGTISGADTYENVYIRDTPPQYTTINMTGGRVSQLEQYDESRLHIHGGYVAGLLAANNSTTHLWGGILPLALARDAATINMHGGEAGFFQLAAEDTGIVNVYGGRITGYLAGVDSATIHLYGGFLEEALWATGMSVVNVFGSDFEYDAAVSDDRPFPILSGRWSDGTAFAIQLYDSQTYDHLRLLPEPTTILLFALGSFCAMRRRGACF